MSASAGRVLLMPKGAYDSSTTYTMLDVVYFNGKSYVCKQTTVRHDPTNTVYWQILLDGATALDDLSDVEITDAQNGDGIAYNGTTHKWENTSPVGIYVQTPPSNVDYEDGGILDLTGIIVVAEYSTGTTRIITSECTFSPANGATLSSNDEFVTITWRTYTTTQAINVKAPIYGVQWDGSSSPTFTRTDASASFVDPVPYYSGMSATPSSPFDAISPWKDIKRVEDANVGSLVEIPKFYYKWTRNSSVMKLQISKTEFEGSHISPAHMDRGDGKGERDVVYVGRYHCNETNYKSTTGTKPKTGIQFYNFVTNIHNLGTNIWMWDFATYWTIAMLYLVEFANWNSQAKIGYGCGSNSVDNMGYTDSMPYHTGTTQSSRTTYGLGTQYRYIEGLWDNVKDNVAGLYIKSDYSIYGIKNPANFGDYNSAELVGGSSASQSGYYDQFSEPTTAGYEYALFPSHRLGSGGTGNNYTCDSVYVLNLPAHQVYVGGVGNSHSIEMGLFHIGINGNASSANGGIGARLMKLL